MFAYVSALLLLISPVPIGPAGQVATIAELNALRSQLAAVAPAGSTLRVDAGAVTVKAGAQPSAAFAELAKAHPGRVRWERGAPVRPQVQIRGGMGIRNNIGVSCTAGFAMKSAAGFNYVLTAGHCLAEGTQLWYLNGTYIGPDQYHTYPGEDYGEILVAYNSAVTTRPTLVLHQNGAGVRVLGASDPVVGQTLCKSGATTGVTCGQVLAVDVTVVYHNGDVVTGMIETNICSLGGDSGSPLWRDPGDRRLIGMGILSGGNSIICDDPSTRSYFNPLLEVMAAYGLSLLV